MHKDQLESVRIAQFGKIDGEMEEIFFFKETCIMETICSVYAQWFARLTVMETTICTNNLLFCYKDKCRKPTYLSKQAVDWFRLIQWTDKWKNMTEVPTVRNKTDRSITFVSQNGTNVTIKKNQSSSFFSYRL